MNSKEAYNKIFDKLTYDQQQELGEEVLRIVYQDLNRLENLEKVIEKIKNLPNCDICDANWHKGCMCLQNNLKKVLLIDNFENMFINCKLTPLPELEELKKYETK